MQTIDNEINNKINNFNKNGLIKVKLEFGEGIIYKINFIKEI